MKKEFNYNVNPIHIAIVSTVLTLFTTITSDFGRADVSYEHATSPVVGSFFIIMFLVIPIFFKGYREYIWTKRSIIILLIGLAINLPIAIYCAINHYNLYGDIF